MDRDQQLIAHLDAKFESIDRRFGETQEQIRENATAVDARLEALTSYIDAKFEGVDRRIGDMEGQIRENATAVDARLEALTSYIDAKFEGVDRRIGDVEGQIRENDGRVDRRFQNMEEQIRENAVHVDRRFDETHEQIRKNRVRIDNTQVKVEELSSKIEAVAVGHVMLGGKLDRFHEEVKIERQLDRGETRSSIKRLRERVDRLEAAR